MSRASDLQRLEMDPQRYPLTWEALREGVGGTSHSLQYPQSEAELNVAPGMMAGYWQAGRPEQYHSAYWGLRRLLPTAQDLQEETVFDLASLSKIIGTSTLAATLVDRGWLQWDCPVKSIFPDYHSAKITVKDLLNHSSGLPWWKPFYEDLRQHFAPKAIWDVPVHQRQQRMRELVLAVQPQQAPGLKIEYSDINFLILGFVLEEILVQPLDVAVQSHVFDRIGMEGAFYRRCLRSAQEGVMPQVAATEKCPWRGAVLQGQVHDDNCYAMGGYGGHSGIFASLRDVFQFVRGLHEGILSRESLQAIWTLATRHTQSPSERRTLGWDMRSAAGHPSSCGDFLSQHTVGHLGYTGTSLWLDLEKGLAVALLTNRVHPSRKNEKIKTYRPRFHNALLQDLIRSGDVPAYGQTP